MILRRAAAIATAAVIAAALAMAYYGQTHGVPRHPAPARATSRPATPASTPPRTIGPAPSPARIDPRRPVTSRRGVLGWAITDIATGTVLAEGGGAATNPSASVIKAWLASDVMHLADDDPNPDLLRDAQAALVDSDNDAATRLYRAGGADRGLWRMIYTCGLYQTLPVRQEWGATLISAIDIAKLGACVANGTAAGPTWTRWILDRMRAVRGVGRFGPVAVLPGADVALKNGWIVAGGNWVVNCLAVIDGRWSIGVITRYPAALGMQHGADLCAGVASDVSTIQGPLGHSPPDGAA